MFEDGHDRGTGLRLAFVGDSIVREVSEAIKQLAPLACAAHGRTGDRAFFASRVSSLL